MSTGISSDAVPLRDAARTREAILRAGQKLFARDGYSATGVRDVAAEAGVSWALVRRYFGSKEGLFRAAVEDVLRIEALTEGPRAEFGVRTVGLLLDADAGSAVAMLLLATADPGARALGSDLLAARIIAPLAQWLGGPDAQDRAVRLHMLWIGFVAARQIMPQRALSDAHVGPTRRWLEQTTQAIADGTL